MFASPFLQRNALHRTLQRLPNSLVMRLDGLFNAELATTSPRSLKIGALPPPFGWRVMTIAIVGEAVLANGVQFGLKAFPVWHFGRKPDTQGATDRLRLASWLCRPRLRSTVTRKAHHAGHLNTVAFGNCAFDAQGASSYLDEQTAMTG